MNNIQIMLDGEYYRETNLENLNKILATLNLNVSDTAMIYINIEALDIHGKIINLKKVTNT